MSLRAPTRPGPKCPACGHDLHFSGDRRQRGTGSHDEWECNNPHCEREQGGRR